jgi:beta-lactamase regulating signal transducer with metallopeptidase domain
MTLRSLLGNMGMAGWVFSLLTQSLILFLIGWALAKVPRRIAPPLKSGVLLTLMILLILLPLEIFTFKTGQAAFYKLPISPHGQAVGTGLEAREGGSDATDKAGIGAAGQNQDGLSGRQRLVQRQTGPFNLRSVNPVLVLLNGFGFIWIAGFLILLGRLFYGIVFLSGFRSSLVKIPEDRLSGVFETVRASFPKTRFPPIFVSPAVDSPVALGILHPMIVLPQLLYKNLSAEELTNILIHETAHIRHFDQVSGLLQRLFTSIYWWNPLAYVLNASLSVTREDVSDNYAIQKSGAHSYAKCLVALAQKTSLITRLPAAVGMATTHISLEERVKHIMSKERVMATKLKKSVVFLLAFSAVLLVAIIGRYSWTLTAAGDDVKIFALPPGVEPQVLAVDRDRIYLCEYEKVPQNPESHIAIYSRSDFSLLAKIGQVGKAAGEFQVFGPGRFYLINDQIWAMDLRKTIVFSRDGNFQKEMQIPREIFAPLYPIVPVGDKFVSLTGDWPDISKGRDRVFGRIYDSDFHMIKEFYGEIPFLAPPPPPPPPPPPGQKTEAKVDNVTVAKKEYQAIPDCIDFAVAEDKIFVADTRKGFHIAVFDSQGAPLYEINKDYIALPVPPEYKAALMKKLQETQGWLNQVANIKFRDSFPAFYGFKIANNKIYVSTYAEQDGLHELVVMNLKGDVLRRSFSFPLGLSYESMYNNFCVAKDRYAIFEDKVYYLVQNTKDGSYELRIQELK